MNKNTNDSSTTKTDQIRAALKDPKSNSAAVVAAESQVESLVNVANTLLPALVQLLTVTWDGNLMSKDDRDRLVKAGLAQRIHGWNWITQRGVTYLVDLGALVP